MEAQERSAEEEAAAEEDGDERWKRAEAASGRNPNFSEVGSGRGARYFEAVQQMPS